jgi:hypothetical protein
MEKMTKQISIIALTLSLCLSQSPSRPKSTLRGVVTAPYAHIWEATVEIVPDRPSQESGDRIVLTTDQSGKYVTELASGQYKVCARYRGLEETCHCVRIEQGRDAQLDFSMQIDKAYVLPSDHDLLDRRLQLLAGKGAMNCGHVHVKETPRKETACGLAAQKQNRAFLVRYDTECSDCELSFGLAADDLGRVFSVRFDSLGMSTRELRASEMMPDGIFTVVAPCPPHPGLRITDAGALSCFSKSDKDHNIMQQLDDSAAGQKNPKKDKHSTKLRE